MKRSAPLSQVSKKTKVSKPTSKKTFYAVPRPLVQYKTGFPKQLAITHKYSSVYRYTYIGPNENVVTASFGVNCLYDPYLGVGGQQPLYFDQLAAIYNHYTVMKSRFKMTIIPNRNEPFTAGIYIDDDANPAVTTLSVVLAQPSTVSKTSQRDAEVVTLYKSWDCKSQFGPSPLDNDQLQGNDSTNPSEIQAFIPFVRPVYASSSDTTIYDAQITIEYDAVWHELRAISGS